MAAGGMRERPNRTVSKTVVSLWHRGFKSHSLRHLRPAGCVSRPASTRETYHAAVTATSTEPDLAALYLETHDRLAAFIAELDGDALDRPVPGCPGWAVRDVVAHLTAIPDDAMAGRLTGPPTEEESAAQVARFRGHGMDDMLAQWRDLAPSFSEVVGGLSIWPAVIDVATHEQDIRGALGQPGARDSQVLRCCAERLIAFWEPPRPVRVVVEDAEFEVGTNQQEPIVVITTRFEAFRWRMGRRSRRQLRALGWVGDPAPLLDHMVVFGPAPVDIIE